MNTKLYVGLKVPDTVAITAFNTLKSMGYANLSGAKRYEYYDFVCDEDVFDKVSKVDVLVNANKNTALRQLNKEDDEIIVVVKNKDKPSGLLSTLQNRLGLNEIKGMEKGVCWVLKIDGKSRQKIAREIAENLLVNEHYQEYEVV